MGKMLLFPLLAWRLIWLAGCWSWVGMSGTAADPLSPTGVLTRVIALVAYGVKSFCWIVLDCAGGIEASDVSGVVFWVPVEWPFRSLLSLPPSKLKGPFWREREKNILERKRMRKQDLFRLKPQEKKERRARKETLIQLATEKGFGNDDKVSLQKTRREAFLLKLSRRKWRDHYKRHFYGTLMEERKATLCFRHVSSLSVRSPDILRTRPIPIPFSIHSDQKVIPLESNAKVNGFHPSIPDLKNDRYDISPCNHLGRVFGAI